MLFLFVPTKDTITLGATLTLDIVRGLDGVFGGSARQDNLRDDVSIQGESEIMIHRGNFPIF